MTPVDPADVIARRFAELAGQPLPLPAGGATLLRWRRLAEVAAEDLALVKLYESHTDALAILAELGAERLTVPAGRWAVWAAEPPDARLSVLADGDRVRLRGRKAWCSGAGLVSHALVTGWDAEGNQRLAAVELAQPGITADSGVWQAPGMAGAGTVDLCFEDVPAVPVGGAGQYTGRPGFWHGGCGIAACWYGGALPLARGVLAAVRKRPDPHAQAHLGTIDAALRSLRALLIETATWLDEHPAEPAVGHALRLRGAADATARLVLDHAGRALGAGPLCRDPALARHFADLPVFLRQTHAERDLAELGGLLAGSAGDWQL
ncbi:MAG TPA: acyl-CoA dehydrogenase family protein [Jatrophihabitans sp.]|nr:acyl-CoA dehydrogenase family protein [Jatrophihabitans sp.]